MPHRVTVEVEGRQLVLSNLDKVLYPDTGFTKGQVLDYYSRIAPVLLPHLAERPLTVRRFPDGVEAPGFYAKSAPARRPDWITVARLPSPGSTKGRDEIDYVVVDGLPALMWVVNLAALELHVPQWRIGAPQEPELLVLDLDPGPGTSVVECCAVALLLRERLTADGLQPLAKTSGSKGLQLSARITGRDPLAYAKQVAQDLERAHPGLIVHRMTTALRPGKVLIDWSQNAPAKTTVCVYSLRARSLPTCSTPVSWAEVEGCRTAADLRFTTDDVLARIAADGDLWATLSGDTRDNCLTHGARSEGEPRPEEDPVTGIPAQQLTHEALERELRHLHATRNDTFLHGSDDALLFHTDRTMQLEREYLFRNPDRVPDARRTRHGSRELSGQD